MSGFNLDAVGATYNSGNPEGEGFGPNRPQWITNTSKIYVVAYPSDWTSTHFLVDATKPTVHSLGAGYGIFVHPKKVSKTRFWKGKSKGGVDDDQPTLFTVEGGGPAPGLTARTGVEWGVNGMLVRFLIGSIDDGRRQGQGQVGGLVGEVREALLSVAGHAKAGDEMWLREALGALADVGLVKRFYVQEFIDVVREAVREHLEKGASWNCVVTVNYEDHIERQQVTVY